MPVIPELENRLSALADRLGVSIEHPYRLERPSDSIHPADFWLFHFKPQGRLLWIFRKKH
jgi:hypothetical protein